MASPTQTMARPRPTAAITSMSGEVRARTENVRRIDRSQRRFSSRKRPDSQVSIP